MRRKIINLKKYPINKARKAMHRIQNFICSNNYNVQLWFYLPYFKKKESPKNFIFYKHCPYCGSKLKNVEKGLVCSGNKLKEIWNEINFLYTIYEEATEYFLTSRLYRFYDMFKKQGKLTCDYVFGKDENFFKKIS